MDLVLGRRFNCDGRAFAFVNFLRKNFGSTRWDKVFDILLLMMCSF